MSEFEPTLPRIQTPAPAQPENLPTRMILGVGVGALVIFAAGVWVADRFRADVVSDLQRVSGVQRAPAHVGEPKVGIVEQTPFALQQRNADLRAKQDERLNSYGWADRPHHVIHIPIERAMEQIIAEHHP